MTKKLTTTAILFALGSVLSMIPLFSAPFGGTVTPGSMVPILLIGLLYGTKWAFGSALVYGILQLLLSGGAYVPPTPDFWSYAAVIGLDYILAFAVLGLSALFYPRFGKNRGTLMVACGIPVFLRFICHLLSGILIWKVYAPEGQSPFYYSLTYNGGYMLPELVITLVLVFCLSSWILKQTTKQV